MLAHDVAVPGQVQVATGILLKERRPVTAYIEFKTESVEDPIKTKNTGVPAFKDMDVVRIYHNDGKSVAEARAKDFIAHLRRYLPGGDFHKPGNIDVDMYGFAQYVLPQFDAWKAGQEVRPDGTPLRDWPFLTPAQRDTLNHFNVKTVEQLAAMEERALAGIMLGSLELQQQALNYLRHRQDSAPALRITALEEQNAKLLQAMEEMRAQLEALQKPATKKQ